MKHFRTLLLLYFLILTLYSYGQNTGNGVSSGSKGQFIQISRDDPAYFATSGGQTWIPVMANFIIPDGEEEKVYSVAETYFRNFSANGVNALRIWISSPFLEIEDQLPGKFDPKKFERIDRLLLLAEHYGIRIRFTLQHFKSISDTSHNWWTNNSVLSSSNSGPFKDIHEYIGTEKGRASYLARARALAGKYKDNAQIFSWELWNEMESIGGNDWLSFTAAMLDSVKAIFPRHLVVQTMGSLHSPLQEDKYRKLLALKSDEYITIHRYLDPGEAWGQYRFVQMPVDSLVATALDFIKDTRPTKPVVFNEIGAVEANHTGPSLLYRTDTEGVLIHDMIFAPFFCGAAGSGSMWHWDSYVEKQHLWYHFRRFANAIKGIDPVREKMIPFSFQLDSVNCYGLRGTETTLIWCRDAANNWRTELRDHKRTLPKNNFILELPFQVSLKRGMVSVYDPWKDHWSKATVENNKIKLPEFTRSLVVILNEK